MTEPIAWVTALTGAGFDKVSVINTSYQCVGASAQDAIASAWKASDGTDINENNELFTKDWAAASTFCFFKNKFNCINKSADFIVGSKGKTAIVAKKVKVEGNVTHCIMAMGLTKGMGAKKGAAGKFSSPADAYNKACSALFDDLDVRRWEKVLHVFLFCLDSPLPQDE